MATSQRGLGRGLDSLFRNAPEQTEAPSDGLVVPWRLVHPCAAQPRKHFDEMALNDLASSIRSQGILQPILVRSIENSVPQAYEIVAGERRWRAAKLAGLAEVPVIIRQFSDDEALTVALIENLQREDLNPLEEALAIQQLRDRLPISQEELATRLGKSRSAVANALRLLQLPKAMQEAIQKNELTPGHARAVLSIPDPALQEALFSVIMRDNLSVRDAESMAAHIKQHGAIPGQVAPVRVHPRAPKPESVKVAQSLLRSGLHPKATISGTGERGRVTIPYESEEALAQLFERLGLKV